MKKIREFRVIVSIVGAEEVPLFREYTLGIDSLEAIADGAREMAETLIESELRAIELKDEGDEDLKVDQAVEDNQFEKHDTN